MIYNRYNFDYWQSVLKFRVRAEDFMPLRYGKDDRDSNSYYLRIDLQKTKLIKALFRDIT